MKKILTILALASCFLGMASCTKGGDDEGKEVDNTVNFTVTFVNPTDLTVPFEGKLMAVNTTTSASYEVAVADGKAVFEKMNPGVYDFSASGEMVVDAHNYVITGVAKNIAVMRDLSGAGIGESTKITLTATASSALVISRAYVNGTKTNASKNYNMPKYWEIFNNSSATVYLDGLCIAQAHGNTTSANTCQLYVEHPEATYASRIATLPGTHGVDKNIPLAPGKSLVIAWNAQNFITAEMTMNVDLTGADYEIFSTNGQWKDNPDVPNMEVLYDCLPTAGFLQMNQALFIFFATAAEVESWETGVDETSYTVASQKTWKAKKVSNEIILDALEVVKAGAKQQKRIADAVDASTIEETNNAGSIVARKIKETIGDRIVLKDTNSSSADFVVIESSNAAAFNGDHLKTRDYTNAAIQ